MADYGTDPFASLGGGVYQNGGWKMRGMVSQPELDQWDEEQKKPTTSFSDYMAQTQPAVGRQATASPATTTPFMPNGQVAPAPAQSASAAPNQEASKPTQDSPYGPGWEPYGEGGWRPTQSAQQPAAAPQQPAAAPQPQAAVDPDANSPYGPGWISYGNGGWAPPGSPAAEAELARRRTTQAVANSQQGVAAANAAPQQTQQQTEAQQARVGVNAPPMAMASVGPANVYGSQGGVNAQGVYTAGVAPTEVYNKQEVPRFVAPDQSAVQNQMQQMIQQLLANPSSLNPQVVDQMKGQSQDQAALMNKQLLQQMTSQAAARGIAPDSGWAQAQGRQIQSDSNANLLNQYRGIDINAATQNRADMMNALGAGNDFQNNTMQRAIAGYNPLLAALGAGNTEQNSFLNSLMNRFTTQEGMLGNQAGSLQNAIQGVNQNNQFNQAQNQQNTQFGRSLSSQELLANLARQSQETLTNRQIGSQESMAANSLAQQGSQFDRNFGFQQQQYTDQQHAQADALAASRAAQGAANDRWADSQAMMYQQQQEEDMNNLLAILLNGGGGF